MNQKLEQELKKLIVGFDEYQIVCRAKAELDVRREISNVNHEGITMHFSKNERLFVVRKGHPFEIGILKREERKFDYGDFSHQQEAGEPLQKHLRGDEEAVLIVRSEFSTKPKGPHESTKVIEVFE